MIFKTLAIYTSLIALVNVLLMFWATSITNNNIKKVIIKVQCSLLAIQILGTVWWMVV